MFGVGQPSGSSALLAADIYSPLYLVVMLVCALLALQPAQAHDWSQRPQGFRRVAFLLPLFVFSLMVMFSQAFNPFLYFQF